MYILVYLNQFLPALPLSLSCPIHFILDLIGHWRSKNKVVHTKETRTERDTHTYPSVHCSTVYIGAETFLLACACTDVAIFRTGEQWQVPWSCQGSCRPERYILYLRLWVKVGNLAPSTHDGVRCLREKAAGLYCSGAEVLTFWHTRLTWRACWVEKTQKNIHGDSF